MWLAVLTALSLSADCPPKELAVQVGPVPVYRVGGALLYESGMQIDADGAPDAYGPEGEGRDALANAGKPGNWWGVVTDTGAPDGTPVVQGPDDPKPGFYVSATLLQDPSKKATDPRRYVDSSQVYYVAISPRLLAKSLKDGARLGDLVVVWNTATKLWGYGVVADVGPKNKLGEASIAMAESVGVKGDPRKGGAAKGIVYLIFPGSSSGWPRPMNEVVRDAQKALLDWGNVEQMMACRPPAK